MNNLYRKGWLTRELDGKAYRYQPEELYVSASKKLNGYGPVDDLVIVDRRTYMSRLVENNLHGDLSAEGVAFATTSFEVAGGENDLLALVGAAYLD